MSFGHEDHVPQRPAAEQPCLPLGHTAGAAEEALGTEATRS